MSTFEVLRDRTLQLPHLRCPRKLELIWQTPTCPIIACCLHLAEASRYSLEALRFEAIEHFNKVAYRCSKIGLQCMLAGE